jgi:hypothetical protein
MGFHEKHRTYINLVFDGTGYFDQYYFGFRKFF